MAKHECATPNHNSRDSTSLSNDKYYRQIPYRYPPHKYGWVPVCVTIEPEVRDLILRMQGLTSSVGASKYMAMPHTIQKIKQVNDIER